jgi:hypothetical protein
MAKIGFKASETYGFRNEGTDVFDLYKSYAQSSRDRARRAHAACIRAEELLRRTQFLIDRSRRLR